VIDNHPTSSIAKVKKNVDVTTNYEKSFCL